VLVRQQLRRAPTATALVEASKTVGFTVPLVVRLEGTNVDLGKKILAESGLAIIAADNLADAAQKVVAAVNATRASGATKKGA
jgi:succinyl-CoA synthetase beta subunit